MIQLTVVQVPAVNSFIIIHRILIVVVIVYNIYYLLAFLSLLILWFVYYDDYVALEKLKINVLVTKGNILIAL